MTVGHVGSIGRGLSDGGDGEETYERGLVGEWGWKFMQGTQFDMDHECLRIIED